jgi:hypothetical protein
VIAFVGTQEKLDWCKNDLNFDHVFNYKTSNFSEEISKVAPDGVELFFDNVYLDIKFKLFLYEEILSVFPFIKQDWRRVVSHNHQQAFEKVRQSCYLRKH